MHEENEQTCYKFGVKISCIFYGLYCGNFPDVFNRPGTIDVFSG